MWRSYLASALGNLSHNRLYAAINIAGLALGVAAALLVALFVRDELSFDRFVPGYRDVYLLTSRELNDVGEPPWNMDAAAPELAARLKLEFPQIASVARLMTTRHPPHLRHGPVNAYETGFDWVDPNFLQVVPLKVLAGDAARALSSPDAVVLTRAAARRYFGRDTPIGETLEVDPALGEGPGDLARLFNAPHPMRVTAVLEDLPSNSSLKGEVFASGLAPFSKFADLELNPAAGAYRPEAYTYVRLKAGASAADVEVGLASFAARQYPPSALRHIRVALHLTPLSGLHFAPPSEDPMVPRGDPKVLAALSAIGLLIVVCAAINFVTLMTALAGRRAVETGVRKAVGAHRRDLIVQFLGEAVIYVAAAMALAVVLVELLLPEMNAALKRTVVFDYLHDPALLLVLAASTLGLGLLAGAYPALVLSAFRPVAALKGRQGSGPAGALVRKALVTTQFAILIGLCIAAATLWRQTLFSLNDRLRVDGSRIVIVQDACDRGVATDSAARAFRERVATLPGVEASVCTSSEVLFNDGEPTPVRAKGGRPVNLNLAETDVGAFEFYGVKPLAGRFFAPGHGGDTAGPFGNPSVVLSETAARRLGFASPGTAVGRVVNFTRRVYDTSGLTWTDHPNVSEVIGVAPDLDLDTRAPAKPLMFYASPHHLNLFGLRLDGRRIPETLAAVDRAWGDTGHRMIQRYFLDQLLQEMYATVILQGTAIGVGAGLALVIAALGLFGLAAHSTEQRTKEIGIRKAMGASSADIVRLLLWQFSRPVLVANLIAWPVAWWAMSRWLSGFAYHVDLPVWLFLAAGGAALLIACATVLTHALAVARAAPAAALRYE